MASTQLAEEIAALVSVKNYIKIDLYLKDIKLEIMPKSK